LPRKLPNSLLTSDWRFSFLGVAGCSKSVSLRLSRHGETTHGSLLRSGGSLGGLGGSDRLSSGSSGSLLSDGRRLGRSRSLLDGGGRLGRSRSLLDGGRDLGRSRSLGDDGRLDGCVDGGRGVLDGGGHGVVW
jgi:hypothetical protein